MAEATKRAPGRPRNPQLDHSIREAAAEVYAESGWTSFNFDAVARKCGVGKSAIYRRWPTREDLLIDAIRQIEATEIVADAQTLKAALLAMGRHQLEWWAGPTGSAYLRLQIDQITLPFLGALYQARVVVPLVQVFRGLVARAVASGELPAGASATLLVEGLSGSITTRMAAIGAVERRALAANPNRYLERLAQFLIAGAAATARGN
jgi:AcrR family transcriptional regulator